MGLMGHDACGLCQGDHHYTAHPDWRARFEGRVTITHAGVLFRGGSGGSANTVSILSEVPMSAYDSGLVTETSLGPRRGDNDARGTCPDCRVEDQDLMNGRCEWCAELIKVSRSLAPHKVRPVKKARPRLPFSFFH